MYLSARQVRASLGKFRQLWFGLARHIPVGEACQGVSRQVGVRRSTEGQGRRETGALVYLSVLPFPARLILALACRMAVELAVESDWEPQRMALGRTLEPLLSRLRG